jgi:lactoylglutathione lyase
MRCIAIIGVLLATSVALDADDALPLMGLAHVGIRVSDLERARAFYSGVLGFENAFTTTKEDGSVFVAYFKVNDHQFIEIFPGLRSEDTIPMTHIAMWTEDLEKTRQIMLSRGLAPTEIHKGPRDHNLSFSLRQLPGQNLVFLEFVQYMPDSLHMLRKGKSLGARRLSTHLEHAGIITTSLDAALKFYVEQLGFKETWRRVDGDTKRVALIHLRMPGPSGDYVELSNQPGNTNLTRTRAGSAAHCSLEVLDIKPAYQATLDRGETKDRKEPRFGLDLRWQFNLFDPDGTRVELMQPRAKDTPLPPVAYGN